MKHEELVANLRRLHLSVMARDYAELARQSEQKKLTYEQYLYALVDSEVKHRHGQKITRLLKEAKLPRGKHLETYDFKTRTGVTETQIRRLCDGEMVKRGKNVVFYGTFGVGKSHLAEAMLRLLCAEGWRCHFITLSKLIDELLTAQRTLTLAQTYRRFDRFDVLAIDELGFTPSCRDGADLFFQLISQRYERKSLIITTNLTYSEWDQVFLNPITTAPAVDRIIHHCETFNIEGPSWRAEEAKRNQRREP